MIVNLLSLIFVLGILVFLHEGGHFLAARAVRAPISVFSFGFGKRLFGVKRGETDYRVSLIPLGGYVRIEGMGPDESDAVGAADPVEPVLLPRWQRALISIAGPLANVIGAVAFIAAGYMIGVQVPIWQDETPEIAWIDPASPAAGADIEPGDVVKAIDGEPITTWRELEMATLGAANHQLTLSVVRDGSEHDVVLTPQSVSRYELGYAGLAPPLPAQVPGVLPGSPAEQVGLQAGDRILAVDGHPVRHFYDVMRLVGASPEREIELTYARGDSVRTLRVTPEDVNGQGKLGIPAPNPTALKRLGPLAAVAEGFDECVRMTHQTFEVIGRMVSGRSSLRQMSGPIDIARFSGAAARAGLEALVWLLGVISLQLAIFNILPIPLLDGGHLALLAFESVRRRDLSWKTKERILTVGFWLIIALVVVVLYNDILKALPPGIERLLPWGRD